MALTLYLDAMLVPLSLFLMLGYHTYLWHSFKNHSSLTTIGLHTLMRRVWLRDIQQGDDKKGILAVQTLRNTLMATTLTASTAIVITVSLAAITNNAYKASHLLNSTFFGSQSGSIIFLKYGSTTLFLLVSFLSSSMASVCLIDASFLINASGELSSPGHTQTILERGFMLAVVGNRVLFITFPLLLWMFSPVLVVLSSVALIWGLYELDFVCNSTRATIQASLE